MVNKESRIVWDNRAKEYLKKSLQFIKKDSAQNADKVKEAIRSVLKQIPADPERYPPDKYRLNNNHNYRAFELYGFRISYFVGENEIRIVPVRHTRQEPLNY